MGEAADMLGLREHRLTTVLSLPWPTGLAPVPTGSSALAPICARLCGAEGASAPSAGSSSGAGLAGGATWCQVDGAVRLTLVVVLVLILVAVRHTSRGSGSRKCGDTKGGGSKTG